MTELAEGARLEIVCSAKSGTVGSNPTLSAREFNKNWTQIFRIENIKNKQDEEGFFII
jgi:hypothetical protein